MSDYGEVLETRGNFRVRLVADEYADEPYDDGASPLMRLDYRGGDWRADHVMTGTRPQDCDADIEAAAQRWGTDFDLLEKYLRAYHGVTKIERWHSGNYWYVTYDDAAWRAWAGAPEGSADMSEYRAWCEGDVWGYVVEKQVTWTADDPGYEDRDEWEDAGESCWGFYGSGRANGKYLGNTARDALGYAIEAEAGLLREARGWIADNAWEDIGPDDVGDLTDAQVRAGIEAHYAGGWVQFARDVS